MKPREASGDSDEGNTQAEKRKKKRKQQSYKEVRDMQGTLEHPAGRERTEGRREGEGKITLPPLFGGWFNLARCSTWK
jgi:hypothetical protein